MTVFRWLSKRMYAFRMRDMKIVSEDGFYYYVPSVVAIAKCGGGWMQLPGAKDRMGDHWIKEMEWLPFSFWKVRSRGPEHVSHEEFAAYASFVRRLETDKLWNVGLRSPI